MPKSYYLYRDDDAYMVSAEPPREAGPELLDVVDVPEHTRFRGEIEDELYGRDRLKDLLADQQAYWGDRYMETGEDRWRERHNAAASLHNTLWDEAWLYESVKALLPSYTVSIEPRD